jgi:hypothetical protein
MPQLCGVLGHKSVHCKARRNHGNRQIDVSPYHPHYFYFRKTGHVKPNCFILNRRYEANGNGDNNVRTGVAGTTADVMFNLVSENSEFSGSSKLMSQVSSDTWIFIL